MAALLYLLFAALAFYFLIVRNFHVFQVRIQFIENEHLYRKYYPRLPSYDEMLWHPRHQLRWTIADWTAYIGEPKP